VAAGSRLVAVRDSRKNVTATSTRPIPVFAHSPIHKSLCQTVRQGALRKSALAKACDYTLSQTSSPKMAKAANNKELAIVPSSILNKRRACSTLATHSDGATSKQTTGGPNVGGWKGKVYEIAGHGTV
jgi:hypothetical protein